MAGVRDLQLRPPRGQTASTRARTCSGPCSARTCSGRSPASARARPGTRPAPTRARAVRVPVESAEAHARQADPLPVDRKRHDRGDTFRASSRRPSRSGQRLAPAAPLRREGRLPARARIRAHGLVLSKGSLSLKGPGLDAAKLSLLLGRPELCLRAGVSTLRVRILDGATELLDRDFTALGGIPKTGVDSRTLKPWVSFIDAPRRRAHGQVALGYSEQQGRHEAHALEPGPVSDPRRRSAPSLRGHDRRPRYTPPTYVLRERPKASTG